MSEAEEVVILELVTITDCPISYLVPDDEGPCLLMIVGKTFELVDGLAP